MSFSFRVFLAFFLLQAMVIYLVSDAFMDEFRPIVHQSTEDALVDMSNLLAEIVSADLVAADLVTAGLATDDLAIDDLETNNCDHDVFKSDAIESDAPEIDAPKSNDTARDLVVSNDLKQALERFSKRHFNALIYDVEKRHTDIRIYITNARGVVVYDSTGGALGEDYSRWNDVFLTLRGQYGARSSRADPDDKYSSVMHVAAPVKINDVIVGVLTVAKPNLKLKPFIDIAKQTVQLQGAWIVSGALLFALVISFVLSRSINQLVKYSDAIAAGTKAKKPKVSEPELAILANSINNMRTQLDGKEYIEHYIYSLTHELKSPVSAISGAAELIQPDMPPEVLQQFSKNILTESQRINVLVSRLLALAALENMQELKSAEVLDLNALIQQVIASKQYEISNKQIALDYLATSAIKINGDELLLQQALDNLLQNAIDFSVQNGRIAIHVSLAEYIQIEITDTGAGIPEYAQERLFERFYSLARPQSKSKSTGLGLCFVKQIAQLHGGDIVLHNQDSGGVSALLSLAITNN